MRGDLVYDVMIRDRDSIEQFSDETSLCIQGGPNK